MSGPRVPAAERLVASMVVVPLGITAKFVDEWPSAVVQTRERVEMATSIGRSFVARGMAELKRRARPLLPEPSRPTSRPHAVPPRTGAAALSRRPDAASDVVAPASPGIADTGIADTGIADTGIAAATTAGTAAPGGSPVPSAERLALPDYDQLPAAHIVGKLEGLTTRERADIEAYESANRHRRTVLGKLAQLRDS